MNGYLMLLQSSQSGFFGMWGLRVGEDTQVRNKMFKRGEVEGLFIHILFEFNAQGLECCT